MAGVALSALVGAVIVVYAHALFASHRHRRLKSSPASPISNSNPNSRYLRGAPAADQAYRHNPVWEVVHMGVALLGAERCGEETLLTLLYSDKTTSEKSAWEDQRLEKEQTGAGVLEWSLPGQWSPRALMEAAGDSTDGVLQVTTLPGGETFSELRLARLHIKSQN